MAKEENEELEVYIQLNSHNLTGIVDMWWDKLPNKCCNKW